MEKYIKYARMFNECKKLDKIEDWINSNLNNYLKKDPENQEEIEHMIDYLVSNESPKRLSRMSYLEVKSNTDKWLLKLTKQKVKQEKEGDTEITLDFENGFKWVKLISENSYKREGKLMSHCVGSYYGKDSNIYSLRDINNLPHCTIEENQQIKGKGNGIIDSKYIKYVVEFLEYLGMEVRDSEMKNLGYFNISKYIDELSDESLELRYKNYLPISSKLKDKQGNAFFDLGLIDQLGLIDNEGKVLIDLFLLDIGIKKLLENASSGNYSKNASSGNYSKNASSGNNSKNASSGNNSKNASSGDNSQNASSGDYSLIEMTGKYNVGAAIGVKSKIKGIIGNWITLAEYDKEGNIKEVKSAKIDGKVIKENTWYMLIDGKFEVTNY